jgi:hypothetical protein
MFGVYDIERGRIVRFRQYKSREEALKAAGLRERSQKYRFGRKATGWPVRTSVDAEVVKVEGVAWQLGPLPPEN